MTDKVKQYIDIQIYDDMPKAEVDRLSKEAKRIKSEMTLEELESLKGKIDPREFLYGIKPLIDKKKHRQFRLNR
jgi:hypothetical protein